MDFVLIKASLQLIRTGEHKYVPVLELDLEEMEEGGIREEFLLGNWMQNGLALGPIYSPWKRKLQGE